ncbi:MAG: hypothetical protein RIM84_26820 [Alphaproteobacteria bacterium]
MFSVFERSTGARRDGAGLLPGLGLAATGAALLGVSCCALPLALSLVGLGGAWLAHLAIFVTVGPYLLAGASIAVIAGWWVAFHRRPNQLGLAALGIATIGLTLAGLIRLYELELNHYLASLWRAQ